MARDLNQEIKTAIETHSDRELIEMICEEMDGQEALLLVTRFFKTEPWKAIIWMRTENPMFGGAMPIILIAQGRAEKVTKVIKNCADENGWLYLRD